MILVNLIAAIRRLLLRLAESHAEARELKRALAARHPTVMEWE